MIYSPRCSSPRPFDLSRPIRVAPVRPEVVVICRRKRPRQHPRALISEDPKLPIHELDVGDVRSGLALRTDGRTDGRRRTGRAGKGQVRGDERSGGVSDGALVRKGIGTIKQTQTTKKKTKKTFAPFARPPARSPGARCKRAG